MSLAIACWVRDTALQTSQRDVQYKKAMLDGMFMKTTQMSTTIEGMQGHNKSFEDKHKKAIKEATEFAWIFKG
jgi:uncharacterized protein YoxC